MDKSREIPLKDLERRERYTPEEVEFLRKRWSREDIDEVAAWIHGGASHGAKPQCVRQIPPDPHDSRYDLRGIPLGSRLSLVRGENAPRIVLACARMEFAGLFHGHLERADLRESHLEGADLSHAHLEGADLSGASVIGANLSKVCLDGTIFSEVQWHSGRRASADPKLFQGFDVRGIRYSDPLFDQFVLQSEFIRRCRETWPRPIYWAWWLTCDCGRSFLRLLLFSAALILIFANFYFWPAQFAAPIVGHTTLCGVSSFWSYLYATSISFFLYGELAPINWEGQIVVALQVICGFVTLAALISIFSMRIVPRQ